eukprot:CAMPEP_0116874638 /NCGR_PEP_ID=MMETSP0463-20121206/6140_1 /TAXON_ID=181622 /ORGANISM="Strombidinopsis sp, Strain SopsisLIS2011" /LENGTH=60 /DNA_ID=CAMNT_0004518563 /DNA_START=28 /DNA_END=210 /DNA_ORIENTATION=-
MRPCHSNDLVNKYYKKMVKDFDNSSCADVEQSVEDLLDEIENIEARVKKFQIQYHLCEKD